MESGNCSLLNNSTSESSLFAEATTTLPSTFSSFLFTSLSSSAIMIYNSIDVPFRN